MSTISNESSPQRPCPGGQVQQRLLRAVDVRDGGCTLAVELEKLAPELEELTRHLPQAMGRDGSLPWDLSMTRRALTGAEIPNERFVLWNLLWTMPHRVVKSIIDGTIAHEALETRRVGETSGKMPGVYVVAITRGPFDKDFLTGKELTKLTKSMRKYQKGLAARSLSAPLTKEQNKCSKFVDKVDKVYFTPGRRGQKLSDFIAAEMNSTAVYLCIEMLQRRLNASREVDPSGEQGQLQSPLYVGSSSDLRSQMGQYKQDPLPSSINTPLLLTYYVCKALSINVMFNVRPVLLIWDKAHLPVAEVLVTTLAQSLLPQIGFNDGFAGRQEGDDTADYQGMRRAVFGVPETSAFAANLRLARVALQSQSEYHHFDERLLRDAAQFEEQVKDMKAKIDQIDTQVSPAEVEAGLERTNMVLRDQVNLGQRLADIFKLLE